MSPLTAADSTPPQPQPTSAIDEVNTNDLSTRNPGSCKTESSDTDQTPSSKKAEQDVASVEAQTSCIEVSWDEPEDDDPANPLHWPSTRKWMNIGVLTSITFLTPLASAMVAPGVPDIMVEFHTSSPLLATFVVSVFVLGFAFGPLVLAPLSELYGRLPVYHACNVLFLIFTICCAVSKNMGMLIAFRFLSGFAGVAAVTCGSGTIADLMPVEERGKAMAFWAMGPILGPIVGPIVGGFLIQHAGWRWAFWLIAIASGIITTLAFLLMRETYPVVLLERKAAKLRKETGNPAYRSKLASSLSPKKLIQHTIIRPLKLLFLSPIVTAMCIYIAIMYGLLYILFTTYTFVFEEVYHFSTSTAGLSFLGIGVGTIVGLAFCGSQSDRIIKAKQAAGVTLKPEDRLPLLITLPSCLAIPFGLILYAWTTDKGIHWIVPQIGTAITGFGIIGIVMCVQTYLVDAFTIYAASAIAANAVLRSLLGALLPLCGLDLYQKIGLGWGNTLLGFIALACAPIIWIFAIYGERIRTNPRWQVNF